MNRASRRGSTPIFALFALTSLAAVRVGLGDQPVAFGVVDEDVRIPIAELDFETAGLPTGWEAWDEFSRVEEVPDRHMWASDSCEAWAERGGDASGWALRGGIVGMALPCGGFNTEPVDTILKYGPFDSRPFVNGVEVALDVKLDLAFEEAFLVCMSTSDLSEPLACFSAGVIATDWASFEPAVYFELGGGQAAANAYFMFRDRDPEPGHTRFGAYIDNIRLVGLSPAATPTAAASESATSSGTIGTPSGPTPVPGSPTPTPTPSATPTGTLSPTPAPTTEGTPPSAETPPPTHTPTSTATPTITPTATGGTGGGPPASATSTSTATPTATPTKGTAAAPTESPSPTLEVTEDPGDGTPTWVYLPQLANH